MPFITVELADDPAEDAVRQFAVSVSNAAVECLGARAENVRLRVHVLDASELPIGRQFTPFITVALMEGRTLNAHRGFATAVTTAAIDHLRAVPANVRIRFEIIRKIDLTVGDHLVIDTRSHARA